MGDDALVGQKVDERDGLMAATFEILLEKWRKCPLDSQERMFSTFRDMAQMMGELPGSEQDAVTTYRLVAVMQNLPDLNDIEWLNAQRERAIERLRQDVIAQAPEVQQVAAIWSEVDGDGL